jgi:hypothetical protein
MVFELKPFFGPVFNLIPIITFYPSRFHANFEYTPDNM